MSVLGSLRAAREWAYPKLTKSAFLEKGVLTPEEFVQAGDELVYRCPTWSWEGGEPSKRKPHLPPDKQYLITRNVPCQARVSSMETALSMQTEKSGDADGDDDEWLISTIIRASENPEEEFDILDEDGEVIEDIAATQQPSTTLPTEEGSVAVDATATAATESNNNTNNNDDEYEDMDAFEDDDVLMDTDAAATSNPSSAANASNSAVNNNLIKTRTYDLSITYDKYYQTPRVWMIGRNAQDQPLTAAEMMQDVISDYANKTVTMENHPLVSGHHASIHPCQHGKVMKAIVKNLIRAAEENKKKNVTTTTTTIDDDDTTNKGNAADGPTVEMYLFIFLKFVSSMIPTINYDFTMNVSADTSK